MKKIEYFYSAHSAFAYIGSAKISEICAAHGAVLVHRPIALSPVVEAAGGASFAGRTKAHVDYYFGREIERWSEYRGVDILKHRPTHHDNALELSNGMLIASISSDIDTDSLAHAVLKAHWLDDIDLADPEALRQAARSINVDVGPLLDIALSDAVQLQHRASTQEAIDRNIFGSPTYFVEGDMFYGQDHLELVERALREPFGANVFVNPS